MNSLYHPNNNDVWQQRKDSLLDILTGVDNALHTKDATPRRKTLRTLLRCLKDFADDQFDYALALASPSTSFPREYGLAATLEQIAHDLEVIERTVHQRMFDGDPDMLTTLRIADWLTYQALLPAQGRLLKETNLTALTYFEKSPSIRVVPYAPVALVGIPFSCLRTIQDFLAIPHEAGHYLYWHGVDPATGLRISDALAHKLFDRRPSLLEQHGDWMEEIFADVYGCLIAGPTIARDFQELQMNSSGEEFEKDDGEHPRPILRPDVYTQTLRKINRTNEATALANSWNDYKKRERAMTLSQDGQYTAERDDVNDVIDVVLELIGELSVDNSWWQAIYAAEPGDAYTKLRAEIDVLSVDLVLPEPGKGACKPAAAARQAALDSEKQLRGVRTSVKGKYNNLTDGEREWVASISLLGWTTEGPNSHWP